MRLFWKPLPGLPQEALWATPIDIQMAALLFEKDVVLFDEGTGLPLLIYKVREGPLRAGEVLGFGNGRAPGSDKYQN